jgi:hypothetical protein
MRPQALPDGSLIVAKITQGGDYQLFHFWPESGRLEALPALVWRYVAYPGVRAFPDARRFCFKASIPVAGTVREPGVCTHWI